SRGRRRTARARGAPCSPTPRSEGARPMLNLRQGVLVAMAAGSLFAAACKSRDSTEKAAAPAGDKTAKIHCQGVNDCKGKGGCQSAKNACAGQNGCKGQGFIETTADDCKTKGGTILASNAGTGK